MNNRSRKLSIAIAADQTEDRSNGIGHYGGSADEAARGYESYSWLERACMYGYRVERRKGVVTIVLNDITETGADSADWETLALETWKYTGDDIIAYIERNNPRRPARKITLSDVCRRFRLRQYYAMEIIKRHPRLVLSDFAYCSSGTQDFGEAMLESWFPTHKPEAANGSKLVYVIDSADNAD